LCSLPGPQLFHAFGLVLTLQHKPVWSFAVLERVILRRKSIWRPRLTSRRIVALRPPRRKSSQFLERLFHAKFRAFQSLKLAVGASVPRML
jgi:hypothetical protein